MIEQYDDEDCRICEICGCSKAWEQCNICGGEGRVDIYDDDPLWYDPGDTEPCYQCGGDCGWWVCLNLEMHAQAKQ